MHGKAQLVTVCFTILVWVVSCGGPSPAANDSVDADFAIDQRTAPPEMDLSHELVQEDQMTAAADTDVGDVFEEVFELVPGFPGCGDGLLAWNEYCLVTGESRVEIPGMDLVRSIDLCDLDHDGFQELLVVRRTPHQLQVFWGAPPSPFQYPLFEQNFEESERPYFVRCLDINADNRPDVIVSGLGSRWKVWLNTGAGVLEEAPDEMFTTSYYHRTWRWLERRDFNADGHLDLIGFRDYYEGASRGYAMYMLNKGDGNYWSPRVITSARDASFVDLDLDGDLDLLLEEAEGNFIQIAIQDSSNPSNPTFEIYDGPDGSAGAPALLYPRTRLPAKFVLGARDTLLSVSIDPADWSVTFDVLGETDEIGMRPWFPRNVDVDADGHSEIVFSLTGRIRFGLLQRRLGSLQPGLLMSDSGPSRERVAIGDLDLDGYQDALFWSDTEHAFRAQSLRTEDLVTTSPGSISSNVSADQIMSGDVNGDGLDDLVGASLDGPIQIFLSDGTGGIKDVALVPTSGSSITGVAVADLDGDDVDEIVAVGTQRLWIVRYQPENGFIVSSSFLPHSVYGVAVAGDPDANGDGIADLYITSATKEVHLYLGDGLFNFELAWSGVHGGDSASVRVGDFTGSGYSGCVTFGVYPKTLTRVFVNDLGVPVEEPTPISLTTRHLEVGDLNGDGRDDLAGGQGGGNVQLAFSTHNLGFLVVERDGDLTDDQTGVAVLDVDGNGSDEIVVPEKGELKVFKARFVAGVDFASEPEMVQSIVKRGVQRRLIPADVNGDGAPDLWSIRSGTLFKTILNHP